MAAQTEDVSRPLRPGDTISGVGVQASARVYQGSIVEIDAAGRVAPGTKAASKKYFGMAETGADNSAGAAGAKTVTVRRRPTVALKKTGTAAVGKMGYLADDQTVTDASTGASKVGRIVADDAVGGGVWVDMADLEGA